jgi:hypothetical protein
MTVSAEMWILRRQKRNMHSKGRKSKLKKIRCKRVNADIFILDIFMNSA